MQGGKCQLAYGSFPRTRTWLRLVRSMESRAELDLGPVDQAVATRARVRLAGASLDRTAAAAALALIVLVAGWLRLSGADWDQGAHLHPDERYLSTVANDVRWPSSIPAYFDVAASPLSPYNVESGRHLLVRDAPALRHEARGLPVRLG